MANFNSPVNVTNQDNRITIHNMNHPKCVSDFIKYIKKCRNAGIREIIINCTNKYCFPNAAVPIAGIIQHFMKKRNISFQFEYEKNTMLEAMHFFSPYAFTDEDNLSTIIGNPLDKIIRFSSSRQVAQLAQAYVDTLSKLCECEEGVLDSISWCINEVMDNVLTHSEITEGYVMVQLHSRTNHVAVCVYDSGIGIYNSLRDSKHHPESEIDALSLALQEGVGDGRGQGNGLFGLYESVLRNGGILSLTSGKSSIMLTESGALNKYSNVPVISPTVNQTIVDFQININKRIDFKTIFTSITSTYDVFDPRIDDMLSETDEFLHFNVFEESEGTGTREAGMKLRNDVVNILHREKRIMILDFSGVQVVSSSFIDEFIAKLVIRLGFLNFNRFIRITNMNENVSFLLERSLYMRISDEWANRSNY